MAVALRHVGSTGVADAKRRYLDASNADGRGGSHSTGVRYWVVFHVHGLGVSPVPDARRTDYDYMVMWEDRLEDMVVWIITFQPYGNFVSAKSAVKYASSVRGWVSRFYRCTLGLGAKGGRIGDIAKGAMRLIDHPPPVERLGVSPAQLSAAWRRRYGAVAGRRMSLMASSMWRSATSFGISALARACEFALDDGEAFDMTQHITPADVTFFCRDGVRHAKVLMRKRKDLRVLRGKHSTVVLAGGGVHYDAVQELWEWIEARRAAGLPDDGPLWCWESGDAISVTQVRNEVKALMAAIGLDPALYGGHSLRIGGATAALAAGVSPTLIRLMGRWSSDVYEIYCRMSLQAALGVGAAIASADVSTFEGGFAEEHLELQPDEVAEFRRAFDSTGVGEGMEDLD